MNSNNNSIILFIGGLVFGIVLTLSLVSRKQTEILHKLNSGQIFELIPLNDPNPIDIITTPILKAIEPSEKITPLAKEPPSLAQSNSEPHWVPGSEGAFIKSKISDSSPQITSTPIEIVQPIILPQEIEQKDVEDTEEIEDAFGVKVRKRKRRDKRHGHRPNKDQQKIQSLDPKISSTDPFQLSNPTSKVVTTTPSSTSSSFPLPRHPSGTPGLISLYKTDEKGILSEISVSMPEAESILNEQQKTFSSLSYSPQSLYSFYYPFPPLVPYHSQSQHLPLFPPYTPSLDSVSQLRPLLLSHSFPALESINITNHIPPSSSSSSSSSTSITLHTYSKPLPDLSLQRAPFEKDNLKLHLCNGVFEAYSASWLTTKEHVIATNSERYNLSMVNCEMASFIHMKESRNFLSNPHGHGMIIQSLDVLDFSVIHLSAYERSSNKHKFKLWTDKQDLRTKWQNIDPVKDAGRQLEFRNNPKKHPQGLSPVWSPEAKRTVVIMPFLGGAMGAGHSELGNRFEYLKTCFWSIYEFLPNIVIAVTRKEDVEWGWKSSELPFFDIMLLEGLPKSASLPVATTQQTKQRLLSGQWDFDYVFFSESDQILISRSLPLMYEELKKFPRRMLLPHRLMPYSDRVIFEVHNKSNSDSDLLLLTSSPNHWMQQSCCLPRQNCEERKTWAPIADPRVPVINYYGLFVPLGNVNFLSELYRPCHLGPYQPDYCP